MLVLTRRIGETLILGTDVRVTVLAVSGHQVRIGVTRPGRSRCTGRRWRSGYGGRGAPVGRCGEGAGLPAQVPHRGWESRVKLAMRIENLFASATPPSRGERFETLLAHKNLVVERIVSSSSITPSEYVQTRTNGLRSCRARR